MARPIRRIHFVELNARINTLAVSPLFPKYGTPLLASVMRERGYDVRMFLEGVSDLRFETLARCDVLCLPVYAPALNKVRELARRMRREHPEVPIVTGGPHVCCFTEDVMDFSDYAVRCEGDEALPELVDRLGAGLDVAAVHGVSWWREGKVVHNPDREPPEIPTTVPDLRLIDGFDRAIRFGGARYRLVNTLQTSRGCRFGCTFCPTPKLFGGAYRNRDIDSIVADVKEKVRYNPFFLVVDNSFLSNRARTRALLERLAKEDLGAHLVIFERHEIARNPELLQLMFDAGVRCIIVGIESLADDALGAYHKRQTRDDVLRSVDAILKHGIHVLGTFVLGADADTPASAAEVVRFARASGISLNVFIVHDLYNDDRDDMIVPLRRRFRTYYERSHPGNTSFMDYHTGSFATYFPKSMKPSTLQRCVTDIYRQVYTPASALRYALSPSAFVATFGVAHGFGVMRMNDTIQRVLDRGYLDYLRQIEDGLYDGSERLVEERLRDLEGLPLPPPLRDDVDMRSYGALSLLGALPGAIRQALELRRRPAIPCDLSRGGVLVRQPG
jgi:hypothetical protein